MIYRLADLTFHFWHGCGMNWHTDWHMEYVSSYIGSHYFVRVCIGACDQHGEYSPGSI